MFCPSIHLNRVVNYVIMTPPPTMKALFCKKNVLDGLDKLLYLIA